MNKTTSEILDLAADDLQANGWSQHAGSMAVEAPHCALGAIAAVSGERSHFILGSERYSYNVAHGAAGTALAEYLGMRPFFLSVPTWNDHPSRTAEDVIATLRAAAAVERVKETSTEKVAA